MKKIAAICAFALVVTACADQGPVNSGVKDDVKMMASDDMKASGDSMVTVKEMGDKTMVDVKQTVEPNS